MRAELERFLLFVLMVAGKPANITKVKLEAFLDLYPSAMFTPFGRVEQMIAQGVLDRNLRRVKVGQYRRLNAALPAIVKLDPATCTLEELEAIKGIGQKSARYFLIRTRPGARHAALDTHILKWLKAQGVRGVPKTTPGSKSLYARLERRFLWECDKRGKTPGDFDYEIWLSYTRNPVVDFAIPQVQEVA